MSPSTVSPVAAVTQSMTVLSDFELYVLNFTQVPWLMSIILATWEAEIGRILFRGQPRQKCS
jgi:hypothetical protein